MLANPTTVPGQALLGRPIPEVVLQVVEELATLQTGKSTPHTLPLRSGIPALEKMLPLAGQQLMLVTGARGVGKTAVALRMAVETARGGAPVSIYSLEGAGVVLVARMLTGVAQVESRRLMSLTRGHWRAIGNTADKLAALPVRIVDSPFATADAIAATKRAAEKGGFHSALMVLDGARSADSDVLPPLVSLADYLRRTVLATVALSSHSTRNPESLRLPVPDRTFLLHVEAGKRT